MRIGVLGGSFNPPHNGHLIVASDAFEALGLDRLLIVPASANPLKATADGAGPAERLEMCRLAFGGDPRFEVSSMEIDRGGLSFTVDTLEALAASNPGAELVLLLGKDSFLTVDRWRRPERIRELARLAVLTRGDDGESEGVPEGVVPVTTRRVDISSSEIRMRLRTGMSVRGFVAESVERFIFAAKLYGLDGDSGARRGFEPGKREC